MTNSIAQKVLESTDIVEVVQEFVSLARKGREFVGLCPFHPDHRPSMQVSPKKQIFKCFACGAGGDALRFIQMRQRVGFHEAVEILAARAGISLAATEQDRQADRNRDQMRQAIAWARTHFQRNLQQTARGKAALDYARRRGLTDATIERHALGFAFPDWDDLLRAAARAGLGQDLLRQAGLVVENEQGKVFDRFRNRLIFPISDALGRPVAFGGRALDDDPAKYLNSPETPLFSKSRVLYGLDLARESIEERREAIVVEGYLDAVLLHQFGFTHAVAALGTALTDAHVKQLRQRADRLILCFDGDQAGTKAADRAVEVSLMSGVEVRVAVLPPGMDPADCVLAKGAGGMNATLQAAGDALEFKWSLTQRACGDGSTRTRRAALEAYLDFVANASAPGGVSPLEQGLLVRRLSELLAIPPEAVYPMLTAARRRPRPADSGKDAGASAASRYEQSVSGLPPGLIAAVESLFGAFLTDGRCLEGLDDRVTTAFRASRAWFELFGLIQGVLASEGQVTRAAVMERCDDAVLCELVGRACACLTPADDPASVVRASSDRIVSELDVQRIGELRRDRELPASAKDPDVGGRAFGELLAGARGYDFALPPETRLNAAAS